MSNQDPDLNPGAQEPLAARAGASGRQPSPGPATSLGRDFWLYLGGQSVSQLGSSFTAFALPLLVYTLTGSAVDLALTISAVFVPYLLFGLLLGAVADRVDRRRALITVDLARALVVLALPAFSLLGQLRVGEIYAVAFIQSTLGILFESAEFAVVPKLVSSADLVTANGRLMATTQLGQVAGPVLAGALVTWLAPVDLLVGDAATFGLSALSILAVRRPLGGGRAALPEPEGAIGPGRPGPITTLLRDVREGLAYVWRHPVLRTISVMMALINFVGSTATTQLVLYGKTVLHLSNTRIGWLFAAGSAGIVLISLSAGRLRRRLPFPAVTIGALIASGLMLVAFTLTRNFPVALITWAGAEGFGLLLNVNTGSLRQAIVPSELLGRVMSIAAVLAWSAIPLGALTGAAVINATGSPRLVYAGIGLLTALIAFGFAFTPIRHGDRYLATARANRAKAPTRTEEAGP